ncbi:MAG: GGDEF domain-containing protein [Spirochaetales bacterium]|nr:GGDEF domain-containing protein [Spirochaetales bacterium]
MIIDKLVRTDLLFYSLFILIFLLIHSRRSSNEENYSSELFSYLIMALAAVTLLGIVNWFLDGTGPEPVRVTFWLQTLSYLLSPAPIVAWMCYLDYNIFNNRRALKKRVLIYLGPAYIILIIMAANLVRPGLVFRLNADGLYSRGPFYQVIAYILYLWIAGALLFFYRHRSLFAGRITQVIILFISIPLMTAMLQTFTYGLSLYWPGNTLAVLLTYILLEQSNSTRDTLTNLFTRSQFESRLEFKSRNNEPFSLILIDMNDFKFINDNFGHPEGDKVLQIVAKILVSDTSPGDLVCRYGGDEFVLLIESERPDICPRIVERLDHSLDLVNGTIEGYRISMSYGYKFCSDTYDFVLERELGEIDRLMYEDKKRRKAQKRETASRNSSSL